MAKPVSMAGRLHRPEFLLGAFIALCFVLRLHLIFIYEINWDEFLNLSMVHDFFRGDLKEPLQTIFVQGFRWLPGVSANEVNQVIGGRVIVYLMGIGSAAFIYLTSRRFMSVTAAMVAVLSYISFSFVIRQGMSFRTDPMATFLLMGAIWVLVCRNGRIGFAALAGFLIGLAGLVTIKSVFYVPVIGVILLTQLWFTENRTRAFMFALVTTAAAMASFAALYLLHTSTLNDPASVLAFLDRTTGKTLGERDFLAAKNAFILALVYNPVFWLLAAFGLWESLKAVFATAQHERRNAIILVSFALILLSLFIYTESYVYYYTFLLAPVAVLCGTGFANLLEKTGKKVAVVVAVFLAVSFLGQYAQALNRTNDHQIEIVEVVHRAFPEPVPYIDRTSMISSYPKKSIFMSSWGMADYYAKGERIMREILVKDQPPFLIANRHMLALDRLEKDEYGPEHFGFFKEDRDILQDNYIRHWGPVFVAGKRFDVTRGGDALNFEILIPGQYQLLGASLVTINGQDIRPGGTIRLDQGRHKITMRDAGAYILRWGNNLYKPSKKAEKRPVFTDF